jgi:hypothetical protein
MLAQTRDNQNSTKERLRKIELGTGLCIVMAGHGAGLVNIPTLS